MSLSYFTTVREAIEHGKKNLQTIPRAFMFAGSGAAALFFFKEIWLPAVSGKQFDGFGLSILKYMGMALVGVVAGMLWRNFHSAAWKIWALENVRDIHRLYQLAEQKGMINKRGSRFNAFEIATAEQKARLAELEARLDGPREMEGPSDLFGPDARVFKYSMKMLLLQLAMFVPFFGFMYFMTKEISFFPFGVFALLLGGFTAFRWLPRLGQPAPIRLDPTGILLKKLPLVAWGDVTNVLLESRQHGKQAVTYLVVSTKTAQPKPIEIELTDIEGSSDEIEQTVNDFWARWR